MELLFLAICILIFGAIIVPFLKKEYVFPFASICTIISTVTTSIPAISVLRTGNYLELKTVTSVFFGTNYFCIDALSSIFVLIISIMSVLGVIYANGYIKTYLKSNKPINSHCFFLMLLIASMLLVVTSFNALFFLVAWEIMSLSSFFLVMFDGNKKEVRKSAIKYLIYMHLSVIFIIAMFIMLSNTSGSLIFTDYTKILLENKHFANVIFLIGFIGFGIKAGFVPFHNWLPDAHPAAPSHVSGIMSGIMIKTCIYGILRILLLIGIPSKSLSYFVLTISLITVLYGVLYAITQHDIKKLLAYSSIENIGIIGVGIAIGMLGLAYNNNFVALFGFTGSFLHLLNHSIFKQLLFFASGNIYLKTHTKNIEVLGGIIKKMPYTSLMFIIGSLAISGLPLFNGFISEILIYAAMLLGIPSVEMNLFIVFIISIAGLALAGTMAITENQESAEWSTKNKEEQALVAEYIRKIVKKHGRKMTENGPYTARAGQLVHLKTDFHFQLKETGFLGDLLKELHPTPAVCGLPKEEAYAFITENEGYDRSYYSGFIGWLDPEGATDIYVNLRCMEIRSHEVKLYAGGGILPSSEVQLEWEETEEKLKTMKNIL